MNDKKAKLGKSLKDAFNNGDKESIDSIIAEIKANGWDYNAISFSGYIADNEVWIVNAVKARNFIIAEVKVDYECNLN